MVKINKRLLPIKAHFFFFMGALGPILPQLSVLGKQIGISPDVMGYITSVLPIMYLLAKPLLGFVADFFAAFRKSIFVVLILIMTLSFAAFYFVPNTMDAVNENEVWNITIRPTSMDTCQTESLHETGLNETLRRADCFFVSLNITSKFEAYYSKSLANMTLAGNKEDANYIYLCLPTSSVFNRTTADTVDISCDLSVDIRSGSLYSSTSFWLFVTLMCIGTIGFNVINSISDAICFDMLGEAEESRYGAQRVWGTIGFGATALLAGFVVDLWTVETIKSFTPALVIMLFFSILDLLSVSKLNLPSLSSSESIFKDVWSLVTHQKIAIFLVFATLAGIIDSFIIYFMFWHMEVVATETGYVDQIKLIEGCVVAAECLAGEVPFFFYSGKIIKKLGYVHCMTMCFFFYGVRLGLISWIPNPWYLVGIELFFQGVTYALCYTCIVAYAAEVAPPGASATVQGLMAGMDDGLGFSIGSLIGGLAFKRFGGRRSFFYFSVGAFVACAAHILIRPSSRKRQYLPKRGYLEPPEQLKIDTGREEIQL